MQTKEISGFYEHLRRIDKATIRAVEELKTLRVYESKKFKYDIDLSFNESIVYYLSNGNPDRLNKIRNTSLRYLYKYYLLNRVKDLNNLLEYTTYLKIPDEKNAGKS